MSDYNDLKIIGINIRGMRKKIGMTQEEFAEKLNISRAALSYYENGERDMTLSTFRILCKKFELNPSDVLMIGNKMQYIALSSMMEKLNCISDEIDKIKGEIDFLLNEESDGL